MGFYEDLKYGNKIETSLIPYLENRFGEIQERPGGCFKEYDFRFKEHAVEIKSDRLAQKTGNFYIENEHNKKPSGITTTTATYWLIHFAGNDTYYEIPTEDLKDLVTTCRNVRGGENSRGYLLPVCNLGKFQVYPKIK